MVTFQVGSTHTLKLNICLPRTYEKDEDDFPISFWLTDSKGKNHNIIKNEFTDDDIIFAKVYHLKKTPQEFAFVMTMPDISGDYTLESNLISSMFYADINRFIKLV